MVALHAAAVDTRIARVIAENTLASYRTALSRPMRFDQVRQTLAVAPDSPRIHLLRRGFRDPLPLD